jgi:hypothetical protein
MDEMDAGRIAKWRAEGARTVVGLDLGQRKDYTAVAVVSACEVATGFDHAYWRPETETQVGVRHLERLPLGTPYTDVVAQVGELVDKLWATAPEAVVVDGTGVGRPVVDLLRRSGLRCEVAAVTITAGGKERKDDDYWSVPKLDLVGGLQVLLEEKRLRVAGAIRDAEKFLRELRDMRVKVGASGREQLGAWREGAHDDLVLAVALAYWWLGKKRPPVWGTQNLVYPFPA